MHKKNTKKKETGQGLVEFALILPLLLLLLIGMVDVGFAFYDYIELVSANREGIRLASRGRFEVETVAQRVVNSGGIIDQGGEPRSKYITTGPDSNFGIIITHFPIDANGNLNPANVTRYVSGTLTVDGVVRPIVVGDSRIVGDYEGFHGDITSKINDRRLAEGYDPQNSEVVVVETFYAHYPIFPTFMDLLQIDNPLTLYLSSGMRVMRDSRID